MVYDITGFEDMGTFAKRYRSEVRSSKGVNRLTIYKRVTQELTHPNSTDIDVAVIGGHTFVKYRGDQSNVVERNKP